MDNASKSEIKNSSGNQNWLKIIFKIISTVFTALMVLIIIFMLYSAVINKNDNGVSIGRYRILNTLTGSMEPAIKVGNLIIIQYVPEDQLSTGDIITFRPIQGSSVLLTHRIVGKNIDNSFITQGDANIVQDRDPVYYDEIVGKMIIQIPMLGSIITFLKTPYGIALIVFIILLSEVVTRFLAPDSSKHKAA